MGIRGWGGLGLLFLLLGDAGAWNGVTVPLPPVTLDRRHTAPSVTRAPLAATANPPPTDLRPSAGLTAALRRLSSAPTGDDHASRDLRTVAKGAASGLSGEQLTSAIAALAHRSPTVRRQVLQSSAKEVATLQNATLWSLGAGQLTGDQAARLLWAWAKLGVPQPTADLASYLLRTDAFGSMGADAVAIALLGVGLTVHVPLYVAKGLALAAVPRVGGLGPHGVAVVAWGLASRRLPVPPLLEALEAQILATLDEFESRHVAVTVWALSTLDRHDSRVMVALAAWLSGKVAVLRPRELAMVAWAFARPGSEHPALLRAVSERATQAPLLARCNPKTLCTLVCAIATGIGAAPELSVRVVAHLQLPKVLDPFAPAKLAVLARALAGMGPVPVGLMDDLASRALNSTTVSCGTLANLLWAFATVRHPNASGLLATVGPRLMENGTLDSATPHHVAVVAWAFAALKGNDTSILTRLGNHALAAGHVQRWQPLDATSMAWAHATMGHRRPGLLEPLAARIAQLAFRLRPREVSITLWSYATLRLLSTTMVDALGNATFRSRFLEMATGQAVATTAWGFARLGYAPEPAMRAIAGRLLRGDLWAKCTPQAIANVAWAFGSTRLRNRSLMGALADVVLARIALFTPQGLSNVAWAFARQRHSHPTLLLTLADRIALPATLAESTPQTLAIVVWAYATLRLCHVPLFTAVVPRALQLLPAFNPQEISILAWAYARLGLSDIRLLDAISSQFQRPEFLQRCNAIDVSMTASALAALRYPPSTPLAEALAARLRDPGVLPRSNPSNYAAVLSALFALGAHNATLTNFRADLLANQVLE